MHSERSALIRRSANSVIPLFRPRAVARFGRMARYRFPPRHASMMSLLADFGSLIVL